MSKYRVRFKMLGEIEVEASDEDSADEKVNDMLDDGIDMDRHVTCAEVTGVRLVEPPAGPPPAPAPAAGREGEGENG